VEDMDSAEELFPVEAAEDSIKGKGSVSDAGGLLVGQRVIATAGVEVYVHRELLREGGGPQALKLGRSSVLDAAGDQSRRPICNEGVRV